jgi:hypothetical protein
MVDGSGEAIMRKTMLTVVAMLLLPHALAAQAPEQRLEQARQRVQAAGIPVALLESKVAEGRAKGVPMERIAAAVEARAQALVRAKETMRHRGDVTAPELGLGADALQSGVSEAVLAAVTDRARGEHRAVAIAALTQLVQMGQVPEHALERVTAALQRGPEALLNLPAQAAEAAQRRGPPADVPGRAGGAQGASQGGGPPAGVPAPGRPPQAGKPTKPGGG